MKGTPLDMTQVLDNLVGQRISVIGTDGRMAAGILANWGSGWIQLITDNDRIAYLQLAHIVVFTDAPDGLVMAKGQGQGPQKEVLEEMPSAE